MIFPGLGDERAPADDLSAALLHRGASADYCVSPARRIDPPRGVIASFAANIVTTRGGSAGWARRPRFIDLRRRRAR